MDSNATFPFLELPAELRVRVYTFFIASSCSALADGAGGKECKLSNLVQICRQIRMEANAELMKALRPLQPELQKAMEKSARKVSNFMFNYKKCVARHKNAAPDRSKIQAILVRYKGKLVDRREALRMVNVLMSG